MKARPAEVFTPLPDARFIAQLAPCMGMLRVLVQRTPRVVKQVEARG